MDIIHDGVFLTGVSVPAEDLVESLECDCLKTITVVADSDGSTGEFYGQLDVRNEAYGVVKIIDSCVYEA